MKLASEDEHALIYTETKFWVYLLCDEDMEVIYVGATTDLVSRMRAHQRNKMYSAHAIMQCNNHSEMVRLEQDMIEKYQPAQNRAGVTSPYQAPKEMK